MSAADSRSVLIDSLRGNGEDFALSNVILPKSKSLNALQKMYRLWDDMLVFAIDPSASPALPVPPQEPNYDGLNAADQQERFQEYKKKFEYWTLIKDAHNRKVPLDKYLMIKDYFIPYNKTLQATSAVKGKRFHAFTRTITDPKPGGLFSKFLGAGGDE